MEKKEERCFVCGKKFKRVNARHLETHDMDIHDYFNYCEKNNFESRGHRILSKIEEVFDEFGYVDCSLFCKVTNISEKSVVNWFGSWNDAMIKAGLEPNKEYDIDESELLNHLKDLEKEYGVVTQNLMNEKGEYSYSLYEHEFGSWVNALDEAGIDPVRRRNVEESRLIAELKNLEEKYDKVTTKIVEEESEFSVEIFFRRFGSFPKAIEKANIEKNRCNYSKDELISELKKLRNEHGKVTPKIMKEYGEYSVSNFRTEFNSWSDAKGKAGLKINPRNRIADEEIIEDMARVYKNQGKLSQSIYDANGAYTHTTAQKRFGSWSNAKEKAMSFSKQNVEGENQ